MVTQDENNVNPNEENLNKIILKNNINPTNLDNNNNINSQRINLHDEKSPHNSDANIIEVRNETQKNNQAIKIDNFAENNKSIRNIMDNALFSQLSKIKVKLLNFTSNLSTQIYNTEGKILPKIDTIDFILFHQNTSISELKNTDLDFMYFSFI